MNAIDFITESNKIEGIHRPPRKAEVKEFHRFMNLPEVTLGDVQKFVSVYQPDAVLRDKPHLNVRVGSHIAPMGGPEIVDDLKSLLSDKGITPYQRHIEYENLHPFTDGNGRSGRMLWAWEMRQIPLGFLHMFYYQTLDQSR